MFHSRVELDLKSIPRIPFSTDRQMDIEANSQSVLLNDAVICSHSMVSSIMP